MPEKNAGGIPLLKGLLVNGEPVADFNPYQLDYYIKEVKSVQPESVYPCQVHTYGQITECIVRNGKTKTIYKVIAGRDISEVIAGSFIDMGRVFVTNNTNIMCDLTGKPGQEVEYLLDVREHHRYRLSIYAGAQADALAQLGVFIEAAGQRQAIAMRGTNGGKERSDYVYFDLEAGECKLKITFGANNMADMEIRLIQIEYA